jgi:hypothetical protein
MFGASTTRAFETREANRSYRLQRSINRDRERAAAAHTLEEADVSVEGGLEGDVGRGGGHGCSGGGGGSSRFYSSWEGFVGSGRGGDGVSGAKRVQTGATGAIGPVQEVQSSPREPTVDWIFLALSFSVQMRIKVSFF